MVLSHDSAIISFHQSGFKHTCCMWKTYVCVFGAYPVHICAYPCAYLCVSGVYPVRISVYMSRMCVWTPSPTSIASFKPSLRSKRRVAVAPSVKSVKIVQPSCPLRQIRQNCASRLSPPSNPSKWRNRPSKPRTPRSPTTPVSRGQFPWDVVYL